MEQEDLFGEKGARFGDLLKLEFGKDYEEIKDLIKLVSKLGLGKVEIEKEGFKINIKG